MDKPYSHIPNQFRYDLLAGKSLIGCWCSLTSPIGAEILGYAGFDWVLVDTEHAPNDLGNVVSLLMALKDSSSAPVIRPQWMDPVVIKRFMDAGVSNFLMPFISNVEEAKAAVAATRYPPEGMRGVSLMSRANKFGYIADYHAQANENTTVLLQIESREGLENAEAIASVEGVDGLFIGPSDLSIALDRFNDLMHPEVQEAIQRIVDAGKAANTAVGILAPVEEHARKYLEMGMSFVAVGSDLALLKNATLDLRKKFKE